MFSNIRFNNDGLIPAIVQEYHPCSYGRILMMAWMNQESFLLSMKTGYMHYWSRSRKKIWKKGETSGHVQKIVRQFIDCDNDTLLFLIQQESAACHTGFLSCFYREMDNCGNILPIQESPQVE